MVGGALLAPRGRELVLADEARRRPSHSRPSRQQFQAAAQVERRRVDRVVCARVAEEPVQVERLRRPDGTRRGHAHTGGGAHQGGRVERRRRLDLAGLRLVRGDHRLLGLGARQGRFHGGHCVEAPPGVRDRERLAVALQIRLDLPVRHRHEGAALELPIDDETQRRGLYPPHGEIVRAIAIGRQRHEPREDGAPDEVDVLTRVGRLREIEIDCRRLGEGGLDLFGRQGRVAHADMAIDDRGVHHGLHARVAALGRRGRRSGRGLPAAGGAGLLLLLGLVVRVAPQRIAAQDLEGLVADEFALTVVVGGDHDLGGAFGGGAHRHQGRGRRPADHPGKIRLVDHVPEVLEAPPPIGVGKHRLHHVPAKADGDGLFVALREVIRLDLLAATAVLFGRDLAAQDLGDLAGRRVLLSDDQPQACTSTGHGRTRRPSKGLDP